MIGTVIYTKIKIELEEKIPFTGKNYCTTNRNTENV